MSCQMNIPMEKPLGISDFGSYLQFDIHIKSLFFVCLKTSIRKITTKIFTLGGFSSASVGGYVSLSTLYCITWPRGQKYFRIIMCKTFT